MADLKKLNISDSGHLTIPSGTSSQRPLSPETGMMRYNTEKNAVEQYDGQFWSPLGQNEFNAVFPENGLQIYLDGIDLVSSGSSNKSIWRNRANVSLFGQAKSDCRISPLGGFEFNAAANSSVSIDFLNAIDYSAGQTICMWLRPQTGASLKRRNPYNQAYGGPGTITHEPSGALNYYWGTSGANDAPYTSIGSGFTVSENETAFISCSRDQASDVSKWYKNGQLINSSTAGGYAATANTTTSLILADGYVTAATNGDRFIGNIFFLMVYNRQLEDSEVLDIYNRTKGRFGG